MTNFRERAKFIWNVANLIRDSFKRGKYQDVILPITVLRRVDSVLKPTKQEVLLMTNLLVAPDLEKIKTQQTVLKV